MDNLSDYFYFKITLVQIEGRLLEVLSGTPYLIMHENSKLAITCFMGNVELARSKSSPQNFVSPCWPLVFRCGISDALYWYGPAPSRMAPTLISNSAVEFLISSKTAAWSFWTVRIFSTNWHVSLNDDCSRRDIKIISFVLIFTTIYNTL